MIKEKMIMKQKLESKFIYLLIVINHIFIHLEIKKKFRIIYYLKSSLNISYLIGTRDFKILTNYNFYIQFSIHTQIVNLINLINN